MTEAEARELPDCPACGEEKTPGALVCWECFKHRTPGDATPLKFYRGCFTEWLQAARAPEPEEGFATVPVGWLFPHAGLLDAPEATEGLPLPAGC